MRKFLVGAILGALVAGNANASIISRSFLDEALTNYATNTALDLKADKADVTDLSDKIGDAWPYGGDMGKGLYNLSWQLYPPEINLENASDLVRFLFGGKIESGINQGGVLNLLGESVFYTGAYDRNTAQIIDNGFRSLSQLTNGWTDSKKKTHLGVMGLNDKIGDLPTEYATVGAALTAMDAKIDARELPSSSDDGQYVLSAKKVGDTITYTWVKMDLTSEEQAQ